MRRRPTENSALVFILKALIPYSRANVMLAYHPHKFFNELEKISGYKQKTLRESFRRAKNKGLIEVGPDLARLSKTGMASIEPFIAKKLTGGGRLMIIFDIPEVSSYKRAQLRYLLRNWRFKQIQKSVWISDYDQIKPVKQAVKELRLKGCVQLYECSLIYPT